MKCAGRWSQLCCLSQDEEHDGSRGRLIRALGNMRERAPKSKHRAGPPMTLDNMRQLGVD
jgi:hypothetical protein